MLYLKGTIKDGKIKGQWTAPRPSPTNSSLLWPSTFEFFYNEAKRIIDGKQGAAPGCYSAGAP